jgi:hypothetical protein
MGLEWGLQGSNSTVKNEISQNGAGPEGEVGGKIVELNEEVINLNPAVGVSRRSGDWVERRESRAWGDAET